MSHQLWKTNLNYLVSPNQLYFLDCCREKIKPSEKLINVDAENSLCIMKGLISDTGVLTEKAIIILNEFETYIVKSKKKVATSVLGDNFLEKITEYRELFPAKRLPSGELARQSVQELKDKFVWFFKTYSEYTWDLVLDAAQYYVYTKRKTEYSYMSTSSFFIKKTNPQTKETSSKLADYCQIIIDEPKLLLNLT